MYSICFTSKTVRGFIIVSHKTDNSWTVEINNFIFGYSVLVNEYGSFHFAGKAALFHVLVQRCD